MRGSRLSALSSLSGRKRDSTASTASIARVDAVGQPLELGRLDQHGLEPHPGFAAHGGEARSTRVMAVNLAGGS